MVACLMNDSQRKTRHGGSITQISTRSLFSGERKLSFSDTSNIINTPSKRSKATWLIFKIFFSQSFYLFSPSYYYIIHHESVLWDWKFARQPTTSQWIFFNFKSSQRKIKWETKRTDCHLGHFCLFDIFQYSEVRCSRSSIKQRRPTKATTGTAEEVDSS